MNTKRLYIIRPGIWRQSGRICNRTSLSICKAALGKYAQWALILAEVLRHALPELIAGINCMLSQGMQKLDGTVLLTRRNLHAVRSGQQNE